MKRQDKNVDQGVLRNLGLFKEPPEREMDLAETRIQQRLHSAPASRGEAPAEFRSVRSGRKLKRLAIAFGAVAAAVALAVFLQMPRGIDAHAIVADGSVYRVLGDRLQIVHAGEKIEPGEILRTNDVNGSFILKDNSRVEMRSHSEFSLERAEDGVRIQLFKGGLIINAAKQVAGHLYVRTRDVTVSVVGTVFLVNAEEEGSRVAVIEGEVRVQQGTMEKTLRPGEQVATHPSAESPSVPEEIAWSRHVEEHLALLQQAVSQQAEVRVAFEVVSIRPGADPAAGVNGRGGNLPFGFGCGGGSMQLDPRRLVMITNVYTLVAMANGKDCVASAQIGLLSGGPSWATTDQFTIQATMPEGSPAYSRRDFMDGNAPRLQLMLQTMLAERFKLTVRRESKQMDVYALVVGKNGPKLTPAREGSCDPNGGPVYAGQLVAGQRLQCIRMYTLNYLYHFDLQARAASMKNLARILTSSLLRPVIDKTGIAGVFDISVESSPGDTIYRGALAQAPAGTVDNLPPIFEVLEKELGLKLESTKAPVEALVIDRVEKPTEN